MQVTKTGYFLKKEEKYMKKLNPVQKQKYQSKLKEFEIGYSNEDIRNKL